MDEETKEEMVRVRSRYCSAEAGRRLSEVADTGYTIGRGRRQGQEADVRLLGQPFSAAKERTSKGWRRKYTADPGRRVRACLHPCSLKRRKTVRMASAENGRTGSNSVVFREELGSAVLYSPKRRKLDRRITTNSCRGAGGREPLDYAVVKGRARQTLPIETERRLNRESWAHARSREAREKPLEELQLTSCVGIPSRVSQYENRITKFQHHPDPSIMVKIKLKQIDNSAVSTPIP